MEKKSGVIVPSQYDDDAQYDVDALHKTIRNSPVRINVKEWSEAVTRNTNVVYPFVFIYDAIGKNDVFVRSQIHCDPMMLKDAKLSSTYVHDIKSHRGTTFVIVQVVVKISVINSQHVVTVFLHRPDANDAYGWRAVLCDPNWRFPNPNPTTHFSTTMRIDMGRDVLKKFVLPEEKSPVNYIVELHRCINVNVCVPNFIIRTGLCFTGICATLMATKIQVLEKKHLKASNGDELMNTIIAASHNFRPKAVKLIHGYHFGLPTPYFTELLRKQEDEGSGGGGGGEGGGGGGGGGGGEGGGGGGGSIERSKSPSNVPQKLIRLFIKSSPPPQSSSSTALLLHNKKRRKSPSPPLSPPPRAPKKSRLVFK
jgi:uncharacterized membrane protein YgcG